MLDSTGIENVIRQRRSVRGFLRKEIPRDTLKKIFELAQRAPSNCNIQPWHVYVCSGASRKRLEKQMLKNEENQIKTNSDYHYPENFFFNTLYLKRQVACAEALYSSMGIEREDKKGRANAVLRNFTMYDAPHVCFIGMHEHFRESIALDVGIYVQTLMLAMKAYGVSSCPQAKLREYPDLIREEFDIPSTIKILMGISFGYEDESVMANKTRVGRAPIEENVIFKS